jgi:hypothetical protein
MNRQVITIVFMLGLLVRAQHAVLAAEEHVHYHITFVVALAVGWSWEEARLIASANLAVDENEETVASLEMTWKRKLLHMSPKSLRFHCFSATNDRRVSKKDDRNQDVKDNLAFLETRANQAIDLSKQGNTHADITQALVAIGVYFHCQQDSWFHSGFGGQWDGHALESFWAMIFGIPDPDQAAARPAKTERALGEMVSKLTSFRRRWGGPINEIAQADLSQLRRFLTHPLTNRMTKREREACDQRLAGHWLYQLLHERDQPVLMPSENIRDGLVRLSSRCRRVWAEVFSGPDAAQWIEVPSALSLKLDLDGSLLHTPNAEN